MVSRELLSPIPRTWRIADQKSLTVSSEASADTSPDETVTQTQQANGRSRGALPATEEDDADGDAQRLSINDISRNTVLAAIRELYRQDPRPCDREYLLRLLRKHLRFGALGIACNSEVSVAPWAMLYSRV